MKTLTKLLPLFMLLHSFCLSEAQVRSEDYDDIYYSDEDELLDENNTASDSYNDSEYKTVYDANDSSQMEYRTTPDYTTTEEYTDEYGDTYVTNNY